MARALLDAKCSPDAQDRDGRTALHIACAMGHVGLIRALIAAGADGALADAQANSHLAPRDLEPEHYVTSSLCTT